MDILLSPQLILGWVAMTVVLVVWMSWLNPGPKRGEDAIVIAIIGGFTATLGIFLYCLLWVAVLMVQFP